MKKVKFPKRLSDEEIERYCKNNNKTLICSNSTKDRTTLTVVD